MSGIARLRAEIDLRESAAMNAKIIERFDTDTIVEIVDDQGDFLEINAKNIAHSVSGFVPRLALIFPPPDQEKGIFPQFNLDAGNRQAPSVPPALPLGEFLSWLGSDTKPPWISDEDWGQLDDPSASSTINAINTAVNENLADWQNWLENVNTSQRQDEAVMDEWLVIMAGGREMFTSRNYFICQQPRQDSTVLGWVLKGQVMRWTGQIKTDNNIDKSMYEVDFYRMNRPTHGWIRGDILAEYIYPTQLTDPKIESNSGNIFNLNKPILRHPQDLEFTQAKENGWTAAQYLDLKGVLDRSLVHFNLCGEICVATLMGSDVIPVLRQWRESGYWRAETILNDRNQGTSLGDLRSILAIFNRVGENYNSTPVSASFVKEKLGQGMFPITGCCITHSGKVNRNAKIRHWVIVEDVVPIGNSGWVRIYNPFQNQDEVYEYDLFLSSSFSGTGMWILPEET